MLFCGVALLLSACYYDVEEKLYPCDFDPAACDSTLVCDIVDVSYAGFVQPLLAQHCLGCHTGSGASGNVNLSGYANVLIHVNNGKLFGSINHSAGFSKMPQGGNRLPDCDIAKLKGWIDAGATDN
ncbi:MAG: hypothetical protein OHK0039_23240 [Bacteroidia bacterium]